MLDLAVEVLGLLLELLAHAADAGARACGIDYGLLVQAPLGVDLVLEVLGAHLELLNLLVQRWLRARVLLAHLYVTKFATGRICPEMRKVR